MASLTSKEIGELSFQELKNECSKAKLSVRGNTKALRKRLREWHSKSEEAAVAKRQKKNPADDLICPITRELPWVPVTAADDRVYEESAVKEHIERQRNKRGGIKSPITNEPMADTLLPAPHIKNLIETLIENKSIQGELVKPWNKKVHEKKAMEKLLKKAINNNGDQQAMVIVGCGYNKGDTGFPKDPTLAFEWFEKAHFAGNLEGTTLAGGCLVTGVSGERNVNRGMVYLSSAASRGYAPAALLLGRAFGKGAYGVKVSKKDAKQWLRQCVGPKVDIPGIKTEAREMLNQLENEGGD